MNPTNPDAAAAEAAREALIERAKALSNRESFSIETTLSGHSELRLVGEALAAGYYVTMTYIALDSAEKNVDRVNLRAEEEIRTVPERDVRRRYHRSLENLQIIIDRVDLIHVLDNSARSFAEVATIERGRIITMADEIPAWAERALAAPLKLARMRASKGE